MKYSHNFLKEGGGWLGALRTRIQTMFICGNGEDITWGSDQEIKPVPTMKQIEELGAEAVAGYYNEKVEKLYDVMKNARAVLRGQLLVCRSDDKETIEKIINELSMKIEGQPEWLCTQ